eukprot:CCRYP_017144-RA/>CCRYP_017144-RA protein AED:0.49 eAED:0.45 QI:0/0/0/0.5/0/0/2/0/85
MKIVKHDYKEKKADGKSFNDGTTSSTGSTPHLHTGKTALVVGHADTICSMLFAINLDIVTKDYSEKFKIPSALPLVYEFVDGYST